MRKNLRKSVSVLFMLFLLLSTFLSPAAAISLTESVNYIALGDSLAAGVTPENKLGTSYTDLIAKKFEEKGVLGSFTKEFSFPGYTSKQVLDRLEDQALKDGLQKANLVTISAGANDVLQLVQFNKDTLQFTYDPAKIPPALADINKNLTDAIAKIKAINPKVNVYLMGYYFPYPYISEQQKIELGKMAALLNSTLETTANLTGVKFVAVYEKFGTDAKALIPNPDNVHPTVEGYQLMADAFFENYAAPAQPTPEYTDVPAKHWAYKEIMLLAGAGAITGRTDTTFEPEKNITRAEAAVALANIVPVTKSIPPNPGFKDVPESHPAYYQIAKMTEIGLFSKAEYFNPNNPLTRAQMSKIIAKAFQLKGNGNIVLKDVPKNYWATSYIQALASNKIVIGFPDGTFRPNATTTRAQFAVILVRTLTLKSQLPN